MALAEATRAEIVRARDRYPHPKSAVLPALWAVQHELGYLSPEGMAEVAELLGLARSQVQAVSTFYSMYFKKPSGRHHLLVCVNVACALRGSDDVVAHLADRMGCGSGETTADGEFTWESTVECLGACGGAPAMQVDHHFHENLTIEGIDALLEQLRGAPSAHHARLEGGAEAPRPVEGPHPPAGVTPPAATTAGPPGNTSTVTGGDRPIAAAAVPASEELPVPMAPGEAGTTATRTERQQASRSTQGPEASTPATADAAPDTASQASSVTGVAPSTSAAQPTFVADATGSAAAEPGAPPDSGGVPPSKAASRPARRSQRKPSKPPRPGGGDL